MTELIYKICDSLNSLDKHLDNLHLQPEAEDPGSLPPCKDINHSLDLYHPNMKPNLLVVYSPLGISIPPGYIKQFTLTPDPPLPESLKTTTNAELKDKHSLYEKLHSLSFTLEKKDSIKSIKAFLKAKVTKIEDIALLKGENYMDFLNYRAEVKEAAEAGVPIESMDALDAESFGNVVHSLSISEPSNPYIYQPNVYQGYRGVSAYNPRNENPIVNRISFEPIISPVEQAAREAKPSSLREFHKTGGKKLGYRFFFNGNEISNHKQPLIEIISGNLPVYLYIILHRNAQECHMMLKECCCSRYMRKTSVLGKEAMLRN